MPRGSRGDDGSPHWDEGFDKADKGLETSDFDEFDLASKGRGDKAFSGCEGKSESVAEPNERTLSSIAGGGLRRRLSGVKKLSFAMCVL